MAAKYPLYDRNVGSMLSRDPMCFKLVSIGLH